MTGQTRLRDTARNLPDLIIPRTATVLLFVGVLALAAHNEHPVLRIRVSPTIDEVRAFVPLSMAAATVLAVYRPWLGLIAVLALTPVWNAAMISLQIGPIQVIPQTVFALALIGGCVFHWMARRQLAHSRLLYPAPTGESFEPAAADLAARAGRRRPFAGLESVRFIELGAAAFALLAIASTTTSPNLGNSANSLLHGILEPIAFGAVLVWLRPSPRGLLQVAGALGLAIAIGSLMDVVQYLWAYGWNVYQFVGHRLDFTQVTFNNVGLFGVIIAAVLPMLMAVVLLQRRLAIPRWVVAAVILAGAVSLVGLFFTVSKSAWLASAGALTLLLLLIMHTWWKRLTTSFAVIVVSAVFIPWPAIVFQSLPSVDSAYKSAVIAMVGKSRFDSWNPTTLAGHGSMAERYYAIEGGVKMAVDHPILGVGLDEFYTYYMELGYRPAEATNDLDHAHSVFPEIAAELGFPALAMLVTVFGAALWAMWRVYRAAHDGVSRTMAAMLIASIAAWIVAATAYGADIYRSMRDQSSDIVVLAVIVGMAVALARWSRQARAVPGAQAFVRHR